MTNCLTLFMLHTVISFLKDKMKILNNELITPFQFIQSHCSLKDYKNSGGWGAFCLSISYPENRVWGKSSWAALSSKKCNPREARLRGKEMRQEGSRALWGTLQAAHYLLSGDCYYLISPFSERPYILHLRSNGLGE